MEVVLSLNGVEHEHAGSVLSLTIQKHVLSWALRMPKFVTHFYSVWNMDTFLLVLLEEGHSRDLTREIHEKKGELGL